MQYQVSSACKGMIHTHAYCKPPARADSHIFNEIYCQFESNHLRAVPYLFLLYGLIASELTD